MTRTQFAYGARLTVLSLLLTGIGAGAFRLSYDAQVDLAIVAGIRGSLAGIYPIIVDGVIVLTTLIRIWNKPDARGARAYIWIALGFWTATSVLGNAYHVVALPAGAIRIPIGVAIALNAIPALSLFIAIHLATTMAFRRPAVPSRASTAPKATKLARRPIPSTAHALGARSAVITDEELLRLSDDEHLSVRAIALETGLGKTTVSERLNRIREQDQDQLAS